MHREDITMKQEIRNIKLAHIFNCVYVCFLKLQHEEMVVDTIDLLIMIREDAAAHTISILRLPSLLPVKINECNCNLLKRFFVSTCSQK